MPSQFFLVNYITFLATMMAAAIGLGFSILSLYVAFQVQLGKLKWWFKERGITQKSLNAITVGLILLAPTILFITGLILQDSGPLIRAYVPSFPLVILFGITVFVIFDIYVKIRRDYN